LLTFDPWEAPRQATVASNFEQDFRKAKAEEVRTGDDESFGEWWDFLSNGGFSLALGEIGTETGKSSRQ
jgi:hypothetical protein